MSTQAPISVIQNGLVLCLDAGNIKSYLGTGTTWTDISKNGYNGVLVNGPTYDNRGLILDGTNDYAYVSHGGALNFATGNFTVSVWHKNNNSSTGYNGIITNDYAGDNSWKIFRDNGEAFYKARCGGSTVLAFPSYTVGRFHFYTYTFNGSNIQLYLDGSATGSTAASSPTAGSNNYIAFGSYRYTDAVGLYYLTSQVIGPVMLYNRSLTSSEILQNYNSTKSRFGL